MSNGKRRETAPMCDCGQPCAPHHSRTGWKKRCVECTDAAMQSSRGTSAERAAKYGRVPGRDNRRDKSREKGGRS